MPISAHPGSTRRAQPSRMRRSAHETDRSAQSAARRTAAVTLPGAANAMFARGDRGAGLRACYLTGAGIANMHLGAPDIGLTTLSEIAAVTAATADAVALPLLVDADTGFGNAVNMTRSVKVLERAGAAGIQIEDQVFPKKCGHFNGKEVIPLPEMVAKIKAAVDARGDGDFQSWRARTPARLSGSMPRSIGRTAFIAAGADATFVEAPTSVAEMERIARELPVPQIANIVFGGGTPDPGANGSPRWDSRVCSNANAALQAALRASFEGADVTQGPWLARPVASRLALVRGASERGREPRWMPWKRSTRLRERPDEQHEATAPLG